MCTGTPYQSRSMFSCSIVRRGPSSIANPLCSSIGLGQLSTTAAAAGTAGTRGVCATFRAATIEQSKQNSASTATGAAGYGSRLMLEKEPASTVGHRHVSRSRCAPLQQAPTFGGGATAGHTRGPLRGGQKQSARPAIGASTHRWFATARDEPADTDTDPGSSESESEFESTIFGAAALEPAAAAEEPVAKKKASKSRKPRKRRTSSSESIPPAAPAAADAAEAVEAPASPEAAATKKPPRARKPRKRRTTATKGDSTPSPPAEPAEGEATATKSEGEGEEEEEAEPGADIPQSRKAAFERARRAGVAQRAREGGGVGDSNSPSSGEGGEEQDSSDDDDGHDSSPSSWQDPAKPVCPEGFSFSAEGSTDRKRAQQEQKRHPVLGRFVADLKYKRVYVTTIDALVQAPVWEKARTLRPVHATEIFHSQKLEADKLEIQMIEAGKIKGIGDMEKKAKGLPGVITLFKRPLLPLTRKRQKYTLGILDGQHRLGALLLLAEEGLWDRSEQNVVVEVFDTKDDTEIAKLFLDINKAEPIALDLGQPRPEDAQKCADEVVLHLYNEFRPMFGSNRARAPSLHAVTFKEKLVRSGVIERHDLFDPDLLLHYLLRVNEMLSERDMPMWELMIGREESGYSTKNSLLAALKKAKRHKFWLGMELSWMLV